VSERFVTVFTNVSLPPVDMVKSVLESEGIICNIKGYDSSRPYLSYGMGIQLQVPEKDKEKAEQIIKEQFK